METETPLLERTVQWVGCAWTIEQTDLLVRYGEWLATEGRAAGGIGPMEDERLWRRHLLDSLLLGKGLHDRATVVDVGTGVGLPGIPLAIAYPRARVIVVDRSGRRVDLVDRVTSVLGIAVEVIHADVGSVDTAADRVVARASLPPDAMAQVAPRLLGTEGEAWIALGWDPTEEKLAEWGSLTAPAGWGASLVRVPREILDSAIWMLRIART